jgi:integrase
LVGIYAAAQAEPPRLELEEHAFLTAEQVKASPDAAKDDRLEALWVVWLTLARWRGEARGLAWTDVDDDAGNLRIRCQLRRGGQVLMLREPKTARA